MTLLETGPENLYLTLSFRKDELNLDYVASKFGRNISSENFEYGVNYLGITSEFANLKSELAAHLHWLFALLEDNEAFFRQCQEDQVEMDISCYWVAAGPNTCPALSTVDIQNLYRFGLNFWFDIYFLH